MTEIKLRRNSSETLKTASLYSEILFSFHIYTFRSPGIRTPVTCSLTRKWAAADGHISKSWFIHQFHPISSSTISILPILQALSLSRDLKVTKQPSQQGWWLTPSLFYLWRYDVLSYLTPATAKLSYFTWKRKNTSIVSDCFLDSVHYFLIMSLPSFNF